MASHTEEVKLKFSAETNTQSFKQLQNELNKIHDAYGRALTSDPLNDKLKLASDNALKLEEAMAAAFNPKLNTYNIDTLNQKLQSITSAGSTTGSSLKEILQSFNDIGATGQSAILSTVNSLTSFNLQLNTSKTLFDKIGEGLLKTFSWSIYSSVVNNLVNGISEAYGYVKALDGSLNDIRIVTGKSADEMNRFAESANKAAIQIGKGTKDYTNAALIYFQQGLGDEEVQARTEVTLKAANVTQQDTAAVSEQLTAVFNGYQVTAAETELYVDKMAKVAATTASDLEELATGMSKVASAANLVGVDIDHMNAMLATTISVTRQSAESVGVAYKTILARMTTISAGGEDEGVDLTSYTAKMAAMGINVLDANNKLRDMQDVIEEVGEKWSDMSREQQIALAQIMAGTRQYNNLTALFDHWDEYESALEDSATAAGTLNEQQSIYMESTAAHLQQLGTAAEGIYDSLLDAKTINKVVDGLTKVAQTIEKITDGFGGLKGIVGTLGPLLANAFNNQIAKNVVEVFDNLSISAKNQAAMSAAFSSFRQMTAQLPDGVRDNFGVSDMLVSRDTLINLSGGLTPEDVNTLAESVNQYGQALVNLSTIEEQSQETLKDMIKSLREQGVAFDEEKIQAEDYRGALQQVLGTLDMQMSQRQKLANLLKGNKSLDLPRFDLKKLDYEGSFQKFIGGSGSQAVINQVIDNFKEEYSEALADAFGKNDSSEQDKIAKIFNEKLVKALIENGGKTEGQARQFSQQWTSKILEAFKDTVSIASGEDIQGIFDFLSEEDIQELIPEESLKHLEELKQKFEDFDVTLKNVTPEELTNQYSRLYAELRQFLSLLKTDLPEASEKIQSVLNDTQEANAEALERVRAQLKIYEELVKNAGMKNLVSGFTSLASAITQGINTFHSFQDALEVLTDSSATFTSKISAIVRVMVSAISVYNSTKEALRLLSKEQTIETAQTILSVFAKKKDTQASREEVISTGAVAVAKSGETMVLIKNTAAWIANLVAMGPVLVVLGLIVAAIALVAVSVIRLSNAWNKEAKALENANKATEQAKKEAQEAAENYRNLSSAIESLKEHDEVLRTLTKGTEEWKEEIEKVHEEVAQLIEEFPELRQYAVWKDGGWEIPVENLEEYQKKLKEIQSLTQIEATQSEINRLDAEYDKRVEDAIRHFSLSGLGLTAGSNEADMIYALVYDEQKVQEALNQAKIDGEQREIAYYQELLEISKLVQQQERERNNLVQQRIDLYKGEELDKIWKASDGSQSEEQMIGELATRGRMASTFSAAVDNYILQNYTNENGQIQVNQDLLDTLKEYYQNIYPGAEVTVTVTGDGVKIDIEKGENTITYTGTNQQAAGTAAEYRMSDIFKDYDVEKISSYEQKKSIYEQMKDAIVTGQLVDFSEISNGLIDDFKEWAKEQGFIDEEEISKILEQDELKKTGMKEKISSKTGRQLMEEVFSEKNLTRSQQEQIADKIEETYLEGGIEGLKQLEEVIENEDFSAIIQFTLEEKTSKYDLSEEIQERMKNLKIDDKDLERYAIKLDIDEIDDEAASRIMNYIEGQEKLNKLYQNREAIIADLSKIELDENGNIKDLTDSQITNLDDVAEAINSRFGADLDDSFIIKKLNIINDFVNGVEGSGQRLRNAIEEYYQESLPTIQELVKQTEIEATDIFADTVEGKAANTAKLDEYFKQLGLSSEQVDKFMTSKGFEKSGQGWIKPMPPVYLKQRQTITTDKYEKVVKEGAIIDGKTVTSENIDLTAKEMKRFGWIFDSSYEGEGYKLYLPIETEITFSTAVDTTGSVDQITLDATQDINTQIVQAVGCDSIEEFNQQFQEVNEEEGQRTFIRKTLLKEEVEYSLWSAVGLVSTALGSEPTDAFLKRVNAAYSTHYSSVEDFEKEWEIVEGHGNVVTYRRVKVLEEKVEVKEPDLSFTETNKSANTKTDKTYTKITKVKENRIIDTDTSYQENRISALDEQLSQLQAAAEFLSGDTLTTNLQEQFRIMEEQLHLKQEIIEADKQDAEALQERIEKESGLQVLYDEFGNIKNRDELIAKSKKEYEDLYATYEAAVDEYNRLVDTGADDEAIKAQKEKVDNYKAEADVANKAYSAIEKDVDDLAKKQADVRKQEREAIKLQNQVILSAADSMYNSWMKKFQKMTDSYDLAKEALEDYQREWEKFNRSEKLANAGEYSENQKKEYEDQIRLGQKQTKSIQDASDIFFSRIGEEGRQALSERLNLSFDIDFDNLSELTPVQAKQFEVAMTEVIDQLNKAANTEGVNIIEVFNEIFGTNFNVEDSETIAWLQALIETMGSGKLSSGLSTIKEVDQAIQDLAISSKDLEEIADKYRYAAFDEELEETNRALSKVQKSTSHLTGQNLINNLKDQNALYQKQIIILEKKKKVIEQQYNTELQALLTNEEFNKWANKTNVVLKDDLSNLGEFLIALSKVEGISKNMYEEFVELLERLKEMKEEIYDINNKTDDIKSSIKDNAKEMKEAAKKAAADLLKEFQGKIELELDITETTRKIQKLRAQLNGLKDTDYLGNFNFGLKQMSTYFKDNSTLTTGLNTVIGEIQTMVGGGTSSLYGTNQNAAFSDLRSYRDQLLSSVESSLQAIEDMKQTYLSAIDAMIQKDQDLINDLKTIANISNSTVDILKLMYGDRASEFIQPYLKANIENAKTTLATVRAQEENAKRLMQSIDPNTNPEIWEKYKQAWESAHQQVLTSEKELLEALNTEWDNYLDSMMQKVKDSQRAMGGNGLSIGMDWDMAKQDAEDYVDYTNSLYETNKLSRKVNEALSDAKTESARKKIMDMEKQTVGYLNDQIDKNKKLTQYQIDRANAVYDLTLKQIALEEGQNNKSKMRLRRDSQGNYRYEYVADEDKIADLQQQVEDAQNKLYNLDKEATEKYTDLVETKMQEFNDRIKEIKENTVITEEEKEEAIRELYERYYGEGGILTEILGYAMLAQSNLAETTADENDKYLQSAQASTQAYAEVISQTAVEGADGIIQKMTEIDEAQKEAGLTTEDLTAQYISFTETAQKVMSIDEKIAELYKEQVSAIEELMPYLESLAEQYKQVAQEALAAAEAANQLKQTKFTDDDDESETYTSSYSSSSSSSGARQRVTTIPIQFLNTSGKNILILNTSQTKGHESEIQSALYKEGYSAVSFHDSSSIQFHLQGLQGKMARLMSRTVSFDTGGYTGEWGNDGRMAMLHQKELVLNSTDTENILSAVELMRQVMSSISGLSNTTFNSLGIPAIPSQTPALDQNVHIEANFPNVSNSSEIEEAFNNLVNLASQRAFNTRR